MLVRVGNEFIQGTTAAGTQYTTASKGELIITYQPKLYYNNPFKVGII